MSQTDSEKRLHIVIVGAGFGGLEAAKGFASRNIKVTLIDKQNYHLFQPLLYQVATAALTPAEVATPIRHIVRKAKNVNIFMSNVHAIDTNNKTVSINQGRKIDYDYLILATGAQHSYFGRDEWEEFAPGLKTIENAFELRQRILIAFERAELETNPEKRQAYLNFVVIGGGPTGVEMAGAIAELAHHSLIEDFRNIAPKDARITLVDGGNRILKAFDEDLSKKAQKHLEELGVEVVLNQRIDDIDNDYVMLGDERRTCRTVVWAAGVKASPAARWIGAETDRSGRILINNDLSVPELDNVFAIGDTAALTPAGSSLSLPGIAPVAKQMGQYVAKHILNKIAGKTTSPFRYRDYGTMATIGRNKAIANIRGWKTSGFVGWILWGLAHIYFVVSFRGRVSIVIHWLWAYLTWQRSVRLITMQKEVSSK